MHHVASHAPVIGIAGHKGISPGVIAGAGECKSRAGNTKGISLSPVGDTLFDQPRAVLLQIMALDLDIG